MSRKRRSLYGILLSLPLLVALVGLFSSCVTGSPLYLWKAAVGQAEILCNRKPIKEVLEEGDLDPEIRRKLELVLKVQGFARSELHLDTANSFQSLSRISRDAAAYNVVATGALSLEAHTYWFPIVGSVPYLGFFSRQEAQEHAASLEKDGMDVAVQDVAGYSTLGWFEDPLLSSQLAYSDYGLVRLVIHEGVHSTVWIPGSVRFNESLASSVEEQVSRQYLGSLENGKERLSRLDALTAERMEYRRIMHDTAGELQEIYTSNLSEATKMAKKQAALRHLKERFKKADFKLLNLESLLARDYNNAHFLSHLAYNSGTDYFAHVFDECVRDWACFVLRMKSLDRPPENWETTP